MFGWILKYNPDQPRIPAGNPGGGQWVASGEGAAVNESKLKDLYSRISKPDGGFTYQPVSDSEPSSGFALSIYPSRSFAKDVKELSFDDLVSYAIRNRDLFEKSDHFLGAWHDPETGKVFLDISVVTNDVDKAEQLARQHDQIAYFDLGTGKSVTVNREATSGGVAKGDHHGGKETEVLHPSWLERCFGQGTRGAVQGSDGAGTFPRRVEKSGGEAEQTEELSLPRRGWADIFKRGADLLTKFFSVLKYNPDQPRAPAGTPIGGQWIKDEIGVMGELIKQNGPKLSKTAAKREAGRILRELLSPDQLRVWRSTRRKLNAAIKRGEVTAVRYTKGRTGPDTGRYTRERLKVHRELLNRVFSPENLAAAKPAPGEKPRVIVLGGRGGSGKSSFEKSVAEKLGADNYVYDKRNFIVLDVDQFKEALARHDGYPELGWRAFLYHEESGRLFDRAVALARKKGVNVVLDVTLNSAHSSRVRAFKKAGYRVEGYYMHMPSREAAKSAVRRHVGQDGQMRGRLVPPEVVLSNVNNESNFDELKKYFDKWEVWSRPTAASPAHLVGSSSARKREGFAYIFKQACPPRPEFRGFGHIFSSANPARSLGTTETRH
jgi:adenylylsulfate kinase-like enzyme